MTKKYFDVLCQQQRDDIEKVTSMTTTKDSFQKASVAASSANKVSRFKKGMQKCDIAGKLAECGVILTKIPSEKRSV